MSRLLTRFAAVLAALLISAAATNVALHAQTRGEPPVITASECGAGVIERCGLSSVSECTYTLVSLGTWYGPFGPVPVVDVQLTCIVVEETPLYRDR